MHHSKSKGLGGNLGIHVSKGFGDVSTCKEVRGMIIIAGNRESACIFAIV